MSDETARGEIVDKVDEVAELFEKWLMGVCLPSLGVDMSSGKGAWGGSLGLAIATPRIIAVLVRYMTVIGVDEAVQRKIVAGSFDIGTSQGAEIVRILKGGVPCSSNLH